MITAVETINNGKTLRGMLHKPDTNGKMPIAIFYHGFTGYKQEKHFMFVKAARALEHHGVASLRFDFSGSGDSDGSFRDMTFLSEVSDALAILDYAQTLDFADPKRIYVIGISMGGAVASVVAAHRPRMVARLCLWAGAGDLYNVLKTFVIGGVGHFNFASNGTVDIAGNVAGKALFDEIEHMDIFEDSRGYPHPVAIIHGDNDDIVPIDNAYRYREIYGPNALLHVLKGANHTFDSLEWETEVLRITATFLTE